ncbi:MULTISPECIES: hypothetical protein [Serratia]|uniref:hypothetical protein n=1 Tax=Serratia TaxID=613 RepID=UPI0018D43116|nr:hypothetical protein [Serratia marcescens]MBH2678216.1 hypothetical protein [Serratia marcescens]
MTLDFEEKFSHYEKKTTSDSQLVLEDFYERGAWLELVESNYLKEICTPALQKAFHLLWVERGHFIREKMNDDSQLLKLLRLLMPPYEGDGLILYRGENIERYRMDRIGFCWTLDERKARQFASGLNAYKSGGVLLRGWAPAHVILAGVHPHSQYLGEYEITIDGSAVEQLEVLATFPVSH